MKADRAQGLTLDVVPLSALEAHAVDVPDDLTVGYVEQPVEAIDPSGQVVISNKGALRWDTKTSGE